MPLTITNVKTELNKFFGTIENNVTGVAGATLPLIGKLSDLPGGGEAANPFGSLKSQVLKAVGVLEDANVPQDEVAEAVAGAIDKKIAGVSAVKTPAGGVDITFATEQSRNTGTAKLDIGKSVGDFFDFKADTGAAVTAALNATLSFSADGDLSLKNQVAPELAVDVAADISVPNVDAHLGVAEVKLNELDPPKPGFQANFGFDLGLAPDGTFTADRTLTSSAGLNLSFDTVAVLPGKPHLLPDMHGKLLVDFPVAGTTFGAPTIAVNDLKVDLGSYLSIVSDVFGDLGKLFNSGPLGTIVDIATEPIPVFNDLAHTFGFVNEYDKVGKFTGEGDEIITIGDLAASQSKEVEAILDPWYQAIDLVSKISKIGKLSNAGEIDFGGGALVGGAPVPDNDPAAVVAALKDRLGDLRLPQEVTDFLGDIEVGSRSAAAAPSKGFTFGLFEHPADVLKILLTKQPVDLVEFDVPPLQFNEGFNAFFPVLGPLGILLETQLKAGIDVDVGYDTQGLIDKKPENGFYVTTLAKTAADPLTAINPRNLDFLPVGALGTTLKGGGGVGLFGSHFTVNAEFVFDTYAYFDAATPEPPATIADGKFRPGADDFGCIFDPVGGSATVSMNVTLEIDFGPFSIERNIPLAEATLADFDVFKCPPPSVDVKLAPGLATAVGADLLLNVGEPERADQRLIVDNHDGVAKHVANPDNPLNESYVIGLARNRSEENINPADDPAPVLVPGQLDVFAFGFTQRVGVPAFIKADFKGGDDMLVIQHDVITNSEVSGGAGFDILTGGGGRDTLRGDADADVLAGSDGDDDLSGGMGDDQLSGGKGADLMNGDEGIDTIDYSRANQDTSQGVKVTITNAGDVIGHGGEAEGDRLVAIESLIGTDFVDDFRAGFGVTQKLVFDGGRGNDYLIGGNGEDLLLGGEGADLLNGDDAKTVKQEPGYDGTSYVTSWGAVYIDLQREIQHGGDAEGDRLFSIEAVEGSINSDLLLGNASANFLVGHDGNDVLEGRSGTDTVSGDGGEDLIYGGADSDTLDGGAGIDTLSYERVRGPVTVDLGASQQRIIGLTIFVPGAAPDSIVMTRPAEGIVRGRNTFENLIGTGAGDDLTGDIGDNRIEGLDGDDIINGDAGFDVLIGGVGADTLTGGSGIDWVDYSASPTGVSVDLQEDTGSGRTAQGGTAEGDTFATVENILGSTEADSLRGNDVDNVIDPNISGAAVTEFVDGRGGWANTLRLDYSTHQADIGRGVVGGYSASNDITHSGSFQRLTNSGTATLDTINFQHIGRLDIVGTRSADTIYGTVSPSYQADEGADRIVTQSGNDIIYAGTGADIVFAGRDNDFVAYGTYFDRKLIDFVYPEGGWDGIKGNADDPTKPLFLLSGGAGIDTLSMSILNVSENVTLRGRTGPDEFRDANLRLANGAAAVGFERLQDVWTGSGDDEVLQLGSLHNDFRTHGGQDIISPGLGVDSTDGGDDFTVGKEIDSVVPPSNVSAIITDSLLFAKNSGDLLNLDYSEFTGSGGVIGTVGEILLADLYFDDGHHPFSQAFATNNGTYIGGAPGDGNYTRNDFANMERLTVTGSQQGDHLEGTDDSYRYITVKLPHGGDAARASNLRGDDTLSGGKGDDVLIGKTGSDLLFGNDGNDILIGSAIDSRSITYDDRTQTESNDPTEIDSLKGGAGADTFVLGITFEDDKTIHSGYFYASYSDETMQLSNRAVITDFNIDQGDKLQLSGKATYYSTEVVNAGTADVATLIYHDLPPGRDPKQLIAELKGVSDFNLNGPYVTYANASNLGVGGAGGFLAARVASGELAPSPAAPTAEPPSSANISQATPAPPILTSWVRPSTSVADLKAAFEGTTAGAGSTLTLSGSAEAIGTFDGDPFGLDKGIILSTGNVEDLPGPNTSESGGSNVTSIPLNFERVGLTSGTTIYRAELTGLGTDIKSLLLTDSGNQEGGSEGRFSGFDLDAIVLSRGFIDAVPSADALNSSSFLPKLDVFDFSAAGVVLTPGDQHGENFVARDLNGTVNGLLDGTNTLGTFDSTGSTDDPAGTVTLGDSGSIGFNLVGNPVNTQEPLYLYIAEAGISDEETIRGFVSASPDTIEPTGDLSTDLGAEGMEGDATGLTYSFTPKTGDNAFSLDVVLFSEELPEFDGTDLTDLYSIKLNDREVGALSNGAALTVKNLVYAASGDLVLNPVGTGPLADKIKADAYTKTMTISGAVDPGVINKLTIEVKDGRDAFLDSGLLIKGGSFKTFKQPVVMPDTDGDGVTDDRDNAILKPNPNQRDTNGDGYGNVADPDLDQNRLVNDADLTLLTGKFGTNDPDADFDGNGLVDAIDLSILTTEFFGKAPGPSYIDYPMSNLATPAASSDLAKVGTGDAPILNQQVYPDQNPVEIGLLGKTPETDLALAA